MTVVVSDHIVSLVSRLEPEQDVDTVFRRLVENELVRRLNRYQLTDRTLNDKYQVSFETFKAQNFVEEQGYTFEVESDFWDWEMAQDGIETLQAMLNELRSAQGERGSAYS